MTDGPLDPASTAQIAEAEQKGFNRGLNVGFGSMGALAAAAVCWRLVIEVPKYEEVFRQVKVPMPGLTLLVLQTRGSSVVLLLLLAGFCIWATRSRGQNRSTIVMNALLFGGALFWLFVVSMALHLPLLSMFDLQSIGPAPR